jgi:hypothetical protein
MASVVVGMFLACTNAFLNGTPGAKHHLGSYHYSLATLDSIFSDCCRLRNACSGIVRAVGIVFLYHSERVSVVRFLCKNDFFTGRASQKS